MALANDHLDELREALKSEERYARDEHARLDSLNVAERVAAGHTWTGIRLEETVGLRRRELRVLVRGSLHEGIGSGDTVVVNGHKGRCVGWDSNVAELSFERVTIEDISEAQVVELGFDASMWVTYRQVLERADELESPLKDALLTPFEPDRFTQPGRRDDKVDTSTWSELNESQQAAAQAALDAGPLAVIHGPPGTGKTRTLVAMLKRVKGMRWALAESNAAVDNLALSAAAAGLRVARLGPSFRMSGPVQELSVDTQIANGMHAASLLALDKEIAKSQATGRELGALFDERRALRAQARAHVLESADVIATTFGTAARRAQDLPPADFAVVDEVTQALEPAVWAAVPYVKRMVVAGDPHQLGPVVHEAGNRLEVGLLDRLAVLGVPMPMLTEQHRMHGSIMGLVSDVYGDSYTAHRSVTEHVLAGLDGVEATALTTSASLFVDTTGMSQDERDPVSRSIFNEVEVEVISIALRELLAAGVRPDHIGVIAPYSAQVERLVALPEAAGVEVATVNAFQGREAEAILVSFTRSNENGELGFVADRRRLTVALTRARRLLWMCGDSATLSRSADYAALLAQMTGIESIWEPPWSEAVL